LNACVYVCGFGCFCGCVFVVCGLCVCVCVCLFLCGVWCLSVWVCPESKIKG